VTKRLWRERFEDINAYERYLSRQGVVIRKFFLHLSNEEQRRRFIKRLGEADKHWKLSLGDLGERAHFGDYMLTYEDTIRRTSTSWAPWYVIPSDRKWFTRLAVAAAIVDTIKSLNPQFPATDPKVKAKLAKVKTALEAEVAAEKAKRRTRRS